MKVLITGPSGAGKTYLAKYFKQQGLNAVDADMIYRLGEWYGASGRVDVPENADEEFLNNHEFLWDEEILKKLLSENRDILLFGFAGNMFDLLHYFDKTFYLDLSPEKINERMSHPERHNPGNFGQKQAQREATIKYVTAELRPEAKRLGLIFVDAMQSLEEIFKQITAMINSK